MQHFDTRAHTHTPYLGLAERLGLGPGLGRGEGKGPAHNGDVCQTRGAEQHVQVTCTPVSKHCHPPHASYATKCPGTAGTKTHQPKKES